MNSYRLSLTLDSPLGTPLSGDTLFGHLCWGIVYHEGPDALESFLAEVASEAPPLVIGDPAPAGMMPRPLVPPADAEELARMESLAGGDGDLRRTHDRLKRFRKLPWLPTAVVTACVDDLTAANLLAAWLEAGEPTPPRLTSATVAHNTINRLTQHTAEEGGLYFQGEQFPPEPAEFDVPILSALPPDRVRILFEQGLAFGYGRDASTGKGCLRVGELRPATRPAAREPNAALALGVFAPRDDDPADGWWQTDVRLGKVSGAYACDEGGQHPPFKFPLVLLTAGSVLGPCRRSWVGRVVPGVHPTRRQVVTVALAPVLPVRAGHLPTADPTPAAEACHA